MRKNMTLFPANQNDFRSLIFPILCIRNRWDKKKEEKREHDVDDTKGGNITLNTKKQKWRRRKGRKPTRYRSNLDATPFYSSRNFCMYVVLQRKMTAFFALAFEDDGRGGWMEALSVLLIKTRWLRKRRQKEASCRCKNFCGYVAWISIIDRSRFWWGKSAAMLTARKENRRCSWIMYRKPRCVLEGCFRCQNIVVGEL